MLLLNQVIVFVVVDAAAVSVAVYTDAVLLIAAVLATATVYW